MVLVVVEVVVAAILLLLSQIQLLNGMLISRGQVDARHPYFLVDHSRLPNVGEWKMIHPSRNLALIDDTACVIELFLDIDRVTLILT